MKLFIKRSLFFLCVSFITMIPHVQGTDLNGVVDDYIIYYGSWSDSDVALFQQYDMVVLQTYGYVTPTGTTKTLADGIAAIKANGTTKVLIYTSLGEDLQTYNFAAPYVGDGKGPVYYDDATGEIVYENRGIASYYLDHWDSRSPRSAGQDGLPDRHGTWGACYVDCGNADWQQVVLADCANIVTNLGADGFFLDTPETPDPWQKFGWTAEGMYNLIKAIDQAYPTSLLLLNRGLFYFNPNYPHQFKWNPAEYIDIALFESYYLDSNYHLTTATVPDGYNYSPFFGQNKYFTSPSVNAAVGGLAYNGIRSDAPLLINIDYASSPNSFKTNFATVFEESMQESTSMGRLNMIVDRLLGEVATVVKDNPSAADVDAPIWQNTTIGYNTLLKDSGPEPEFYMTQGSEPSSASLLASPPAPRPGVLKAIPGNQEVTLRWDVAIDQTRRVKYNVYYSQALPFDFNTAIVLPDVIFKQGADYTSRGYKGVNIDDVSPYEFTVSGLSNNAAYYFAVRAEDATTGVTSPVTGAIGPNGGIEETNTNILAAVPRSSTTTPISIWDGVVTDWAPLPLITDTDGTEWQSVKISDDEYWLYLYLKDDAPVVLNDIEIYFNVDRKSYTGDTAHKGADYRFLGGNLQEFDGTAWSNVATGIYSTAVGNELEVAFWKSDFEANKADGGLNLYFLGQLSGDEMPEHGVAGFSYNYTTPVTDTTGPVLDAASVVVSDANIDGMVNIAWSLATDINDPITYSIDDGAGVVYNNASGVPYSGLTKASVVMTGLTNGVSKSFRIIAEDKLGNKSYSNLVAATPTLNQVPPFWVDESGLQSVTRSSVAKDPYVVGDGQIKIFFNKADDLSHQPPSFNVYYNASGDAFSGTKLATVAQLPTFAAAKDDADVDALKDHFEWVYTITGLTNGQSYSIGVRAVDRVGNEEGNVLTINATPTAGIVAVNGDLSDWVGFANVLDANDNATASNDILDSSIYADADNLYFYFNLEGNVASYIRYEIYLDSTGAGLTTSVPSGANSLDGITSDYAFRMYNTGSSWVKERYTVSGLAWSAAASTAMDISGSITSNIIEGSIPLSEIPGIEPGMTIGVKLVATGVGWGTDESPDMGEASYTLTPIVDGTISDWSTLPVVVDANDNASNFNDILQNGLYVDGANLYFYFNNEASIANYHRHEIYLNLTGEGLTTPIPSGANLLTGNVADYAFRMTNLSGTTWTLERYEHDVLTGTWSSAQTTTMTLVGSDTSNIIEGSIPLSEIPGALPGVLIRAKFVSTGIGWGTDESPDSGQTAYMIPDFLDLTIDGSIADWNGLVVSADANDNATSTLDILGNGIYADADKFYFYFTNESPIEAWYLHEIYIDSSGTGTSSPVSGGATVLTGITADVAFRMQYTGAAWNLQKYTAQVGTWSAAQATAMSVSGAGGTSLIEGSIPRSEIPNAVSGGDLKVKFISTGQGWGTDESPDSTTDVYRLP